MHLHSFDLTAGLTMPSLAAGDSSLSKKRHLCAIHGTTKTNELKDEGGETRLAIWCEGRVQQHLDDHTSLNGQNATSPLILLWRCRVEMTLKFGGGAR